MEKDKIERLFENIDAVIVLEKEKMKLYKKMKIAVYIEKKLQKNFLVVITNKDDTETFLEFDSSNEIEKYTWKNRIKNFETYKAKKIEVENV